MTNLRRRRLSLAFPALAASAIAVPAFAQAPYPSQPIRIVVPFGPGGSPDQFSRQLAKVLSERVRQPVIVENKPGANSMLGTGYVARNVPADGYTILYGTNSGMSAARSMVKNMTYDPAADLAGVAMTQETSFVMVTSAANKGLTLAELIRRVRANPGKIELAGASVTTTVTARMMANAGKLDMVYVPYKENSRMLLDLMAGQVLVGFSPIPAAKPLIEQGKVIALAITGPERVALLPDTPALSEQLPGVALTTWTGFFVPVKTPRPVVDFLHRQITEITRQPELQANILESGRPLSMTPAQIDEFVRRDEQRWAGLFKAAGIEPQ